MVNTYFKGLYFIEIVRDCSQVFKKMYRQFVKNCNCVLARRHINREGRVWEVDTPSHGRNFLKIRIEKTDSRHSKYIFHWYILFSKITLLKCWATYQQLVKICIQLWVILNQYRVVLTQSTHYWLKTTQNWIKFQPIVVWTVCCPTFLRV